MSSIERQNIENLNKQTKLETIDQNNDNNLNKIFELNSFRSKPILKVSKKNYFYKNF